MMNLLRYPVVLGVLHGYDERRHRISTSARKNILGFSIRYDDCRVKSRKKMSICKKYLLKCVLPSRYWPGLFNP